MGKIYFIALLQWLCLFSTGQSIKHPDLSDYNEAKKRLLVISTGKFIYNVAQGQIDLDSSLLLSCRIYGLSRMLPFDEGFEKASLAKYISLLDSGKSTMVEAATKEYKKNDQLPLLLLLGSYYLFKAGDDKNDLLKAKYFIANGLLIASDMKSGSLKSESNLLAAKYYAKTGNQKESDRYFAVSESIDSISGDKSRLAQDWLSHGDHLPYNSPDKMVYLNKSDSLYKRLNNSEKLIEVKTDLIGLYFLSDWDRAERELLALLEFEKKSGFRHTQFTYYVLAYLNDTRGHQLKSMEYTEYALKTMQSTGDDYLISIVYYRLGHIYFVLHKKDEALRFYRLSYGSMDNNTKIFWDKSIFSAVGLMNYDNRANESLLLMDSFVIRCSPLTLFEKIHLAVMKGESYGDLESLDEAERHYEEFDILAQKMPIEFIHAELPTAYYYAAQFFFHHGKLAKARYYSRKAGQFVNHLSVQNLAYYNMMLFNLDSLEGNYKKAVSDHWKFKFYYDSLNTMMQSNQMAELLVKYEAEKKDNSILRLTNEGKIQQDEIRKSNVIRNVTIVAAALLLLVAVLSFILYNNKKRTGKEIALKNASLEELVKEKEWLVQEIHHRVKNNLHTVIALLESQSVYLQDDALHAIRDSQQRIFAMSLTHQKLYQSPDLKTIDMSDYLSELIIYLKESLEVQSHIIFDTSLEPVELDVSQAVPLGLILNEALTNALKYAFPGRTNGRIQVSMTNNRKSGEIYLRVEDNGIGIPENYTFNKPSSLGMKLMKGLSKEIHAQFDITSSNEGTKITVQFRKTNMSRPNTFLS